MPRLSGSHHIACRPPCDSSACNCLRKCIPPEERRDRFAGPFGITAGRKLSAERRKRSAVLSVANVLGVEGATSIC
jgi:hypothetical protein